MNIIGSVKKSQTSTAPPYRSMMSPSVNWSSRIPWK